MNVSCPECGSVFRVDPAKVPVSGVRARCSVCGGVIPIGSTGRIESDFTASVPDPMVTPMSRAQAAMTPATATAAAHPTPAVFRTLAPTPAAVPRQAAPVVAPVAPASPPAPERPAQARVPQPASPAPPLAPPPPSPPRAPAPAAKTTPRAARAPINPFLANDPNVKARRLARALVSDIIAYFPEKHADGLRTGSLRELFREEIKKSYEEYVDQMGREFAESTTHFQDALNDVLAGGKKVF